MLEYKERYASSQVLLPALVGAAAAGSASPPADDQHQLWRFSSEQVFGQTLDGFLLQLSELRHVFEAAVQFQQLEKLEIGGLRGKLLTERIREVSFLPRNGSIQIALLTRHPSPTPLLLLRFTANSSCSSSNGPT